MDTKTAFDEAMPRNIAKIMKDPNAHGWIISGLLREMADLEEQAMLEYVESKFPCVEAPRLWMKMSMQILANVEEVWVRRRMGVILVWKEKGHTRFVVS